jgi:hypothetical protein
MMVFLVPCDMPEPWPEELAVGDGVDTVCDV